MKIRRGAFPVLLCIGMLGACATPPPQSPVVPKTALGAVGVREDLSGRFIALIGPRAQLASPYLGTPDTNFVCLRSFIDRSTGQTAHQLYVAASYDDKRDWQAAHDARGQPLKFIPISRFKISCAAGDKDCSYTEEFAVMLPESGLRGNPQGFAVTFTDDAGKAQTVTVSGTQIAAQLAALAEEEKALRAPIAAGAAASQPTTSHQP